MSLMSTVTVTRSVSPMCRPSRRSFSASPPGSRRDSVSPCSSRSTIALCSRRSRCSAPSVPAETPSASFTKTASTSASTASGGRPLATAMALIGLPSATMPSSSSSAGDSPPCGRHRADQGVDDGRVEGVAPGGHGADRVDQLVALGDVVLQQVAVAGRALGQQRDGVLGIVVLREDDDAGPGMALAHLLGGVDPLPVEGRRHPDVGHQHLRCQRLGALDDLVVVGRHAHDLGGPCGARSSARTPSRTIRLSSARSTEIVPDASRVVTHRSSSHTPRRS